MPAHSTSGTTTVQTGSPPRNCRIYERHVCGLETSCQPPSAWGGRETRWPAQVRDISQGGLALVLRRRFEKGAGLAIELPGSDADEPSTVLVRVVRVSAQPDGCWLLGCSFISALSEEEVRALAGGKDTADEEQAVDDRAPSVAAVQPSDPSRTLVGKVILEGILADGRLFRRQLDRLYLRDAWPVAGGRRFVLYTNRGSAGKTGIRLVVDSCTLCGTQWVLRCRLPHANPDHIAAALSLPLTAVPSTIS